MISFVEYNFEIFKLIYLLLQLTQPSKVDYLFLDLAFKSLLQFEFNGQKIYQISNNVVTIPNEK